MSTLVAAAEAAIACLDVGEGDHVLVLCNEPQRSTGEALAAAARRRTLAVRLLEYPALSRDGEEPPTSVGQAMLRASAVFASTTYSISHTQARLAATAAGSRIASMCSLAEEPYARAMTIDYATLKRWGAFATDALTRARSCRITSPAGTDIVLDLQGRTGTADDGDLQHDGAFGNLPAGEAYIAPIETVGEGTIVFDGALAGYGLLRAPLGVHLEDGRAVAATGEGADWLLSTLDAGGEHGRSIAEVGIGTNPGASLCGEIAVDEKALGTAHVAFGTSASFGGANVSTVHIDGVMNRPTILLDGAAILSAGVLATRIDERPESTSPSS